MKKIVLRIVIALAVIIAALLIFASTRPDSFRVERSLSVNASPERIHALINNFHNWSSWSPYEKLDPAMKRTFSGDTIGIGAVYGWSGDSKAGSGRMEIIDTTSTMIKIKLDFIEPFEGHNTIEFITEPNGNSTKVTWAMYGPSNFPSKFMGIFFNLDHMIGKDFETGLSNLKTVSEK